LLLKAGKLLVRLLLFRVLLIFIIITRHHYSSYRRDHHGSAVPALGAILGASYRSSIGITVRMDTTALDEALALDASKGPDGCYSRYCIPEFLCFR